MCLHWSVVDLVSLVHCKKSTSENPAKNKVTDNILLFFYNFLTHMVSCRIDRVFLNSFNSMTKCL